MIYFYISLSTYLCFLILKLKKGISLLNTSNNRLKEYFINIKDNFRELFLTPELLSIIVIVIALQTNEKITAISFIVLYMFLFLYFFKRKKEKILIKENILLIVTLGIFFVILNIIFYLNYSMFSDNFLIFYTQWIYYIVLIIYSYLSYFVIFIAKLINKPFELIFSVKRKL